MGREKYLDRLHQQLSENVVVVHGTGGMGKSQLVREYVYRHEEVYKPVFWINTTSLQTTQSSFVMFGRRLIEHYASIGQDSIPDYISIAHHLGMSGLISEDGSLITKGGDDVTERIVEAVKRWFTKPGNDQWLLVFDNVDDLSFKFSEFFPTTQPGSGCIILTSRRLECARTISNCTTLELGVMDEQESIDLLARSSRREISAREEASDGLSGFVRVLKRTHANTFSRLQ